MKKIKVAIIDDGVNSSEFYIPDNIINISINDNGFIEYIDKNYIQVDSHGTICTAIFYKFLKNSYIEFVSIIILNSITKKGNIQQLIYALKWCAENEVDIINCSFGTIQYTDFSVIKDIVNQMTVKGIIIVAAMNNNNTYSLPACLNGVIGVKHNFFYHNGLYKLRWYPFDDIEIMTSGVHQLCKKSNEIFISPAVNSYAAPVITGAVLDIIHENGKLSFNEILLKLQDKAKTVIGNYVPQLTPYIWNIYDKQYDKMYDYNECSNIIKKYLKFNTNEIDIPILNIYGDNNDVSIGFILLLSEKLKNNNYYYVITEFIYELKYGFILFPENYNKISFCNNIYNKFKNDILILHSRDSMNCDVNIEIDKLITLNYDDGNKKSRSFNCCELNDAADFLLYLFS